MNFVCPKCGGELSASGGSAKCRLGHSYDRARGGYYNLFLSSSRGVHGDNAEMVAARRDFLNTGAYLPLAERVAEIVSSYGGGTVLDMGCGEGYYTDMIEKALQSVGSPYSVVGFDISKDAVARAAKRNPSLELAVASAYKIPLSDSSVDLAVNMFSPLAIEETSRVLRSGGIYVMAIPGENHLFGLKAATYNTPYKNEVAASDISGFELIDEVKLSYRITLDTPEKIKSLFMMTPYAYRTGREERERVLSLKTLETEVEFIIFVYKRH